MGGIESGAEASVAMPQQINLYRGDESAQPMDASARLLLMSSVLALAAVLLVAGFGEYYLRSVRIQRDAVAQNLAVKNAELEALRDKLVAPAVDPFLEAELAGLARRQRHLNANLAAMSRHQSSRDAGFSAFFAGLARNPVNGLWFSNVGLSAGGNEVLLKGSTTQPALVPRLLQELAAEPAFAGRTFRRASFQRGRDDDRGIVEFELRSGKAEEVGDAG